MGDKVKKIYIGDHYQVYPERKPGPNILAYYPFTSTTQATDQSGNGRNLTTSGVTYGDVGGVDCATFSGSVAGNNRGAIGEFELDNYPMTISLWFKTNGNGSGGGFTNRWFLFRYVQVESSNWGSGNYVTTAYTTNGGMYAAASYGGRYGTGYGTDETSSAYSDGVWHNAVYVLSGTLLQLFIDKTKVGEVATPSLSNGLLHKLYIGRNVDNYYGFNGNMSELIMQKKTRNKQEIEDYYDNMKSNYGL